MSRDALFQLGMGAVPLNASQKEDRFHAHAHEALRAQADHFIEKDGVVCAGSHLIIDLYDSERMDDLDQISETLIRCVAAAGATLLPCTASVQPNGGITAAGGRKAYLDPFRCPSDATPHWKASCARWRGHALHRRLRQASSRNASRFRALRGKGAATTVVTETAVPDLAVFEIERVRRGHSPQSAST